MTRTKLDSLLQLVKTLRKVEQEMVDKGDASKLETSGNQEEIVQEPDVSFV